MLFLYILSRKKHHNHCCIVTIFFSNLTKLSWFDGCTFSLLYKSWTCSVFQFKSIIKPTPISTAIKLSEPQINLADREILLEYLDQYCSPGLEGEQGTLKAFGSASSLRGKRALHQAYQYSNPGEEEVPQRGKDRLSTLSFSQLKPECSSATDK